MDPQALLSPEALTGAIVGGLIGIGIARYALDTYLRHRKAKLIAERAKLTREAAALPPKSNVRAAKFKEATRLPHQELKLTVR